MAGVAPSRVTRIVLSVAVMSISRPQVFRPNPVSPSDELINENDSQ